MPAQKSRQENVAQLTEAVNQIMLEICELPALKAGVKGTPKTETRFSSSKKVQMHRTWIGQDDKENTKKRARAVEAYVKLLLKKLTSLGLKYSLQKEDNDDDWDDQSIIDEYVLISKSPESPSIYIHLRAFETGSNDLRVKAYF